jgi:ADP-dependent NAD(P)H-hydrate dehydratase
MSAPRDVALQSLSRFPLPSLDETDDKDGRGAMLVIAGGAQVPGAGILTGLAALRAGAGKLKLAATKASALGLGLAVPEAAVLAVPATPAGEISAAAGKALGAAAGRADAIVIGPGMVDEVSAAKLALALMEAAGHAAFVLDAAALTGLDVEATRSRALPSRLVLTPHAGEMAKLTGRTKEEVLADPVGAARTVSEALGAVVVMKGDVSFIAWRRPGPAMSWPA